MLKISGIRLNPGENENALCVKAAKILGADISDIRSLSIKKKSLDARKKNDIHYLYSVCVGLDGEERFINSARGIVKHEEKDYFIPRCEAAHSPVIIGFGPAGMFCALILARAGLKPVVLERGEDADARKRTVDTFMKLGILNENSNIQFGEGGAGAFSDGKLNTGIKNDRIDFVLRTLAIHGAPQNIVYDAKPHIGTDILPEVVKSIRREIISLGGKVLFSHRFTGFMQKNGGIEVRSEHGGGQVTFFTNELVLAIGHSSRDTLEALYKAGLAMEQKAFSMGARIEHPQSAINKAQFGSCAGILPPAEYKLSCAFEDGSSAYTFCMCPGGYVVAAASEAGGIVTNGMSRCKRDGKNANSAVLVTLRPEDFPDASPLSGMYWQRSIEKRAYEITRSYKAPAQSVGDFLGGGCASCGEAVEPTYRPGVVFTDLRRVFPEKISNTLSRAIPALSKKLKCFDMPGAVLTAPETRSSSPVRIPRNDRFEASVKGIYPCGEGAGYSGGIMSSAVDGMKIAEAVTEKYRDKQIL